MLPPLGWGGIARLGLVQSSLGAIVMLASSLLNRIMVVEYSMAAALPAGLVAFHYGVQLSRPKWGHGSDAGWRRTPWIIGGMAVLGAGGILATYATTQLAGPFLPVVAALVLAYAMIGIGVGAAGTSLLALLATRTAEPRRPAAASLTWIMMIVGIVISAGTAGALLDPFSPMRLLQVAAGVVAVAFGVTCLAVWGVEGAPQAEEKREAAPFGEALRGIWGDPLTRLFSIFVFFSMLAYSMQDLILEPFAGLVFKMTPGQSTSLSGVQHQGVLAGMILVGVGGHAFGGKAGMRLKRWIVSGCFASALALASLAMAARAGPGWPLAINVAVLGFANGMFAVAAIGSMLELAGRGGPGHEGIRMGLWGAAQASAFGIGGFVGAFAVDRLRAAFAADGPAFEIVFAAESVLFLLAALIALRLNDRMGNNPAGRPHSQEAVA
ncbi:BCD family MFS transporter [Sandarakinorhabdus sp. AAP62]|uniref:BCD family MFS transporter n=1 Tax=Sandarakinorhabdus sp. AAP62 TaxID=1248916 RepID=UPI001FB0ECBB|nr:BCD family MFS transporter [Sandarakinorhabdus sp. AAP62]